MRSEGDFSWTYRDYIRDHGAPSTLRRDNAKEEQSELVQEINRELMIKYQCTVPCHPQQNPVKSNAIWYLKGQVHILLDRTDAPDSIWYLETQYITDIHSICSDFHLPNKMAILQYQQAVTSDIQSIFSLPFGSLSYIWTMNQVGQNPRKGLQVGWE